MSGKAPANGGNGWVTVDKRGKKNEKKKPDAETNGVHAAKPKEEDGNKRVLLMKQEKERKKAQGGSPPQKQQQQQSPPPTRPALPSQGNGSAPSPPSKVAQGQPAAAPSGPLSYVFRLNLKPTGYQLKGIVNRGNTCYQNAVLQGLLSVPAFLNMAKSLPPPGSVAKEEYPLVCALRQVVFDFKPQDGHSASADAWPLLIAMQRYSKEFKLGQQQDACEYLVCVLDALSREITALSGQAPAKAKPSKATDEGWQTVDSTGRSRGVEHTTGVDELGACMQQIFGGKMSSRLAARGEAPSVTLQPFTVLPLDVISDKHTSVENFLLDYTASQQVELASGAVATKQESFCELPNTLCVCLKLWFDPSTKSQVSRKLQLNHLLTIHASSNTARRKYEYSLTGVVCHKGPRMTAGHYTAVVRKGDRWFSADDASITSLPAYSPCGAEPYILFYTKRQ